MSSPLNSPLLHRHRHDSADDAAQRGGDPDKISPPPTPPLSRTDEAADLQFIGKAPKVMAPSRGANDDQPPSGHSGRHRQEQNGEKTEKERLLSKQSSRLVWDVQPPCLSGRYGQEQNGDIAEPGRLISKQSSRLVWDGSGFLPGASELGSELQGMGFASSSLANPKDELRRFRCSVFWLWLDQSTLFRTVVSWTVFFLLAIAIPVCYVFVVDTEESSCNAGHPFDVIVQGSEVALAFISFACLTHNLRKHGLRCFLFLNQVSLEPTEVQRGYIEELNKAFRLLPLILLPSFIIELVHQVWWFACATVKFPLIQSSAIDNILLCTAVMVSWLYKTTVFLLPCILFRLTCYLQILRFEGYIKMLETVSEVSTILKQYMRLRQQLNIISHRYRMFIILSLVCITASQFMSLLMITTTSASFTFFAAGNLAVCSAVQLMGFVICLHGAARITHRAQRIVSIVSQWHAISTCQHYEVTRQDHEVTNWTPMSWVDEADRLAGTEYDNDLSSALNMYWTTSTRISNDDIAAFQMRQAFVWYIQQDQAGISLFGYKLDRSFVYTLASAELSLVLFILGLTIVID